MEELEELEKEVQEAATSEAALVVAMAKVELRVGASVVRPIVEAWEESDA